MIQELNAFSKSLRDVTRPGASRPVFYEVKDTIEHRLRRELKPTLDPGEYIVADAVLDRSLGWGDLAKCMSVQDFVDGVIDDDKSFKLDQDGIPIFAGVGFERRHTGDLLKQLRTKGIIERLPVANSGRAYLWFPAPRHQLACLIRDLTGRPGDLPELLTRGL